jgi:hypothetical protein
VNRLRFEDEPTTERGRTLSDEITAWLSWRAANAAYRSRAGWDHNVSVFGILWFAVDQKWISKAEVSFLLVFLLQLVGLIVFQVDAGNQQSSYVQWDSLLMIITLACFEWRVWRKSKLVFAYMLSILVGIAIFAVAYSNVLTFI